MHSSPLRGEERPVPIGPLALRARSRGALAEPTLGAGDGDGDDGSEDDEGGNPRHRRRHHEVPNKRFGDANDEAADERSTQTRESTHQRGGEAAGEQSTQRTGGDDADTGL